MNKTDIETATDAKKKGDAKEDGFKSSKMKAAKKAVLPLAAKKLKKFPPKKGK